MQGCRGCNMVCLPGLAPCSREPGSRARLVGRRHASLSVSLWPGRSHMTHTLHVGCLLGYECGTKFFREALEPCNPSVKHAHCQSSLVVKMMTGGKAGQMGNLDHANIRQKRAKAAIGGSFLPGGERNVIKLVQATCLTTFGLCHQSSLKTMLVVWMDKP